MDPNTNLAELRGLVREILDDGIRARYVTGERPFDHCARVAELVDALDGWITRGGFLPTEWAVAR